MKNILLATACAVGLSLSAPANATGNFDQQTTTFVGGGWNQLALHDYGDSQTVSGPTSMFGFGHTEETSWGLVYGGDIALVIPFTNGGQTYTWTVCDSNNNCNHTATERDTVRVGPGVQASLLLGYDLTNVVHVPSMFFVEGIAGAFALSEGYSIKYNGVYSDYTSHNTEAAIPIGFGAGLTVAPWGTDHLQITAKWQRWTAGSRGWSDSNGNANKNIAGDSYMLYLRLSNATIGDYLSRTF